VCVGETLAEREEGRTLNVIAVQVDGSVPELVPEGMLVIAYEPVWAIGSGLTPTTGDIAGVHAFIRERLAARFGAAGRGVQILYGGSVKPSNAREILAVDDVDGALVGGASLKAADFLKIVAAYDRPA
jgi:triosephosphate isomerase